ncbi:MAG TPA: methyltransferase domain-containing protein [Stellaceae bacterium]|nr:methyltransferase domain-containing protein [Stellaceae bacterium]
MEYEAAVQSAPPGWRHFTVSDLDRLSPSVRAHELARIPAEDRRRCEAGDPAAAERVLRAMFWTLVYHLEPRRWDALAEVEPISDALLAALPMAGRAVDVGAGSGRLTRHLAARCEKVVAVDPSPDLLCILRGRLPQVHPIAAWADALPLADGWSSLTTACGALGPEPAILRELERVTARGGVIALINPEDGAWFERHGWERMRAEPAAPAPHERAIDDFFGPPDPPSELLLLRVG